MHKIFKSISLRDQPVLIAVCEPEICCTTTEDLPEEESESEAEKLLAQTQAECEETIALAKSKADTLLSDALVEVERIKAEAQEQGRSQGYEAGYEAGFAAGKTAAEEQVREEMKEALSQAAIQASAILKATDADARQMIIQAEREIVQLVLAITQKILAREMEENPVMVLPIVRSALEKVRDQQEVTVRVHSYDFELIMQARHDLQSLIGREQPILVQADDSVTPGNCLIDTTSGTVDARIDTQFEAIKKSLLEVMP